MSTLPAEGWPIIGHRATVDLLRHSINAKRVSHAYLLHGPPAVGKFALSRAFAQALNCTAEAAPCGQCRACQLIAAEKHPDVRVIQMPADKREIPIDLIRVIQHEAALKPYEAIWKVYIIRDAENMSEEAANCLLKTLEEPPPQVILVLTAPTPEALLPTIVSRCQPLAMHPVPISDIEQALAEGHACDAQSAHLLARLSAGRIGWAIAASRDQSVLEARQHLMDQLQGLTHASRVDRLAFAAEHGQRYTKGVAERETVHAMLATWSTWWRDLLLIANGCSDRIVNVDRVDTLRSEARRLGLQPVRAFLDALSLADLRLRQNVNPRLALEVLALAIPSGSH
jgi:DNA polymerase-3 subunit delta'